MKRAIVVKLTRRDGTTLDGFRYGVGVPATAPGGGELCSEAYLHAYRTAREAVFFRSLHGVYDYDTAWEAEAAVEREDTAKLGCTRLTLRRRIALPTIDTETRVTAAVLLALDVYDPLADQGAWGRWAEAWLSGEDRTTLVANEAADAAYLAHAAYAADTAAADAAAAYAAEHAAYAAGRAAYAAYAAGRAAVDALLEALGM